MGSSYQEGRVGDLVIKRGGLRSSYQEGQLSRLGSSYQEGRVGDPVIKRGGLLSRDPVIKRGGLLRSSYQEGRVDIQ